MFGKVSLVFVPFSHLWRPGHNTKHKKIGPNWHHLVSLIKLCPKNCGREIPLNLERPKLFIHPFENFTH